jgi:4-amino-4-deoxy-L-arabinose transferase-like glycosyltransferase
MDNSQKNSEKSAGSWSYKKRVIVLIITLSILRLIISSIVDLGNDESYYWLYSQFLKWSYFDHPPLVAIWIRVFTANLWLQQYELFLRLGSVAGCAMSTWFMYKCVSAISTERSGWFAAILYNASFYAGITAGLFIMPDSPQMVFWTLSLWMIARINADESKWLNWIILGIASGLCIMSKVHGVFIWLGVGMYIIFIKRSWLVNPRLFVAAGLTIITASPILIWNIQNNFVMYQFHAQRIVPGTFSLNWHNFLREFFGQIIINNVLNVILIFLALVALFRNRIIHVQCLTIYNFIGIPLALSVLVISLYRHTFPHWSGPAYITLIPIAAIYLSELNAGSIFPLHLKCSLGLHIIFLILCVLEIMYYPGNFGNKTKKNLGKGDITLDMNGWSEAGKKFAEIYRKEISSGKMLPASPVVCYNWWGSHIEYYFCRPLNIQMIGLGVMNELHEYVWLNKNRLAKVNFNTAYCIVPSDENYNVHNQYLNFYSKVDTVAVIEIFRNHVATHNFYVFRLTGWKNNLPLSQ